jgi:starch phosphorylase
MAHGDYYLHFADFNSYVTAHEAIGQDFNHKQEWAKKSLMNITRTGMFSSDRTIKEYAAEIWDIQPQIKNSERW